MTGTNKNTRISIFDKMNEENSMTPNRVNDKLNNSQLNDKIETEVKEKKPKNL